MSISNKYLSWWIKISLIQVNVILIFAICIYISYNYMNNFQKMKNKIWPLHKIYLLFRKKMLSLGFYFQVIKWMQTPTEISAIRDFQEWKETCDEKGQPYCSLPNACPLTTRELPGETLRLFTCMECPNNYPWLLDPTGDGFSVKKWAGDHKRSIDREPLFHISMHSTTVASFLNIKLK